MNPTHTDHSPNARELRRLQEAVTTSQHQQTLTMSALDANEEQMKAVAIALLQQEIAKNNEAKARRQEQIYANEYRITEINNILVMQRAKKEARQSRISRARYKAAEERKEAEEKEKEKEQAEASRVRFGLLHVSDEEWARSLNRG